MPKFDEQKFSDLCRLPDSVEKDNAIISFIEQNRSYFLDDGRSMFNSLCMAGLLKVIQHCEKSIPSFSLYDHTETADNISNISFVWSIESGNINLVKHFFQHPDFHLFLHRNKSDHYVGQMLQYYKERGDNFNLENYSNLMFVLADKIPSAITEIFDLAVRNNLNDEATDILQHFLVKYKHLLSRWLCDNNNDILSLHCMISLKSYSFSFADFIKKQFVDKELDREVVELQLYWCDLSLPVLKWMIERPDFFLFQPIHFTNSFDKIFRNSLKFNTPKIRNEYFNHLVNCGLYTITLDNYKFFITDNITPLVKKYYKQFNKEDLSQLYVENSCTEFIQKQKAVDSHNKLMKSLAVKKSDNKSVKI